MLTILYGPIVALHLLCYQAANANIQNDIAYSEVIHHAYTQTHLKGEV